MAKPSRKRRSKTSASKDRQSNTGAGANHADRPVVGSEIAVQPTEWARTGDAVALSGRYTVYVRGGIPGEPATVRVTGARGYAVWAKWIRSDSPAPTRRTPSCHHFGECGRCSLQHLAYPSQLRAKQERLQFLLGAQAPIEPILGLPREWGTRNKVHYAVGWQGRRPYLSHANVNQKDWLEINECPVHHPSADLAARKMIDVLSDALLADANFPANIVGLVVRVSETTGQCLAILVTPASAKQFEPGFAGRLLSETPGLVGVAQSWLGATPHIVLAGEGIVLAGAAHLSERVQGVSYRLTADAFFQTNAQAGAYLLETVLRYAGQPTQPGAFALDLFAGVGLFSAPLAKLGFRVTGVEANDRAIAEARANANANGLGNLTFVVDRVETFLEAGLRETPELTLLDPPRAGAGPKTLSLLTQVIRPKRIIYISCEPETLAKELATLQAAGYELENAQAIDMFPHTFGFETAAKLRRL